VTAVTAWLAARAPRERALLAAAAGLTAVVALAVLILGVRDDLAALRARVAGHERELAEVRRLAGRLQHVAPVAVDGATVLARLAAAAGDTVGRERIAALTPEGDDRVTLQVSGAPLPSIVGLLHALEVGAPSVAVVALDLRKESDAPDRFDVTLEVAR